MKTRAERSDGGWRISGRKWLITGATGARFAIIMGMTEDGATMFLSDIDRDEIVIERVLDTLDSALPGGHAVISLDGLVVADADVLGEVGKGLDRKSVVEGKSVSVRVDLGGRRIIKKKKK